jgi:hypothetical protein
MSRLTSRLSGVTYVLDPDTLISTTPSLLPVSWRPDYTAGAKPAGVASRAACSSIE